MMVPTIPIDELKAHMVRQTKLLDEGERTLKVLKLTADQ